MVFLEYVRIVVLPILLVDTVHLYPKSRSLDEFNAICDKVTEEPSFLVRKVVGKKWRVFYSWNSKMAEICVDLTFKYSNPLMINSIRTIMQQYLEEQPIWDDASLYLTMSTARHTLLVVDKTRAPGQFIQVPHLVINQYLTKPMNKEIPLFRMALKLIYQGRYLILSDCGAGVTLLLAHMDWKPDIGYINKIAAELNFGDGSPACTKG